MNALCLHAFFARVFPPCATNGPLKEQIACKSPSSPSFRCTAEWGMDKALPSEKNVCVELIANVVVAAVKLCAAFFTASASMAAEAVHSIVDVVLVALSFFTLGSGFSMAEGVRRRLIRTSFVRHRDLYRPCVGSASGRGIVGGCSQSLLLGQGRPRLLPSDEIRQGPSELQRPSGIRRGSVGIVVATSSLSVLRPTKLSQSGRTAHAGMLRRRLWIRPGGRIF